VLAIKPVDIFMGSFRLFVTFAPVDALTTKNTGVLKTVGVWNIGPLICRRRPVDRAAVLIAQIFHHLCSVMTKRLGRGRITRGKDKILQPFFFGEDWMNANDRP
jgi:hypothetical protein